jgi:hypothetical protein
MLHKVVFSVAGVVAIINLAGPVLQLSMSLILVTDPISLALERFWLAAIGKCTRKRLDIFVYVLRPVGWLVKFLDLEA